MTTSLRIKCHIIRSFDECITLINQQKKRSLVIPLQPFFMDQNPHILPLSYFFNDPLDPHLEFNLRQVLQTKITEHAPTSMSKKSLRAIAVDVFNVMQRLEDHQHSYPWLSNAIMDTKNSIEYQTFYNYTTQIIERTIHWIDHHYDHVIVFGINPPFHQLLYTILNSLHYKCTLQWMCPGTTNNEFDNADIHDFFPKWQSSLETITIEKTINQCQSVAHECLLSLLTAKKAQASNQCIAIVSPNQTYTNELQRLSKLHNIHVEYQHPIYLKKTSFGHFIYLIIQWIKYDDIYAFRDILYHPLITQFDHCFELNQWVCHIIDDDIYLKSNTCHIEWIKKTSLSFNPSKIVSKIITATANTICDIIEHVSFMFEYSNTSYLNYVSFEKIKALWLDATNSNSILDYALFKLDSMTIQLPSNEQIICISPEDMCKYPRHQYIVLGLGSNSWSITSNHPPYLTIDLLHHQDHADILRISFACWLANSNRLISLSYSKIFNDAIDTPLHFIKCHEHIVHHISTDTAPFKRSSSSLINAPLPSSISPSNLELYQRCPSAYFFKVVLKLSPKKPMSEYLVFGNLFHQLIEKIIDRDIDTLDDVNQFLIDKFNPAMANLFLTKLSSDNWDISELISFIHAKDFAGLSSECKLSTSMNGITIKGRADMVYKTPDAIEVFDFKTGAPPTFSDISHFHYLQLGLYGLMLYQEQTNNTIRGRIISKKNTVSPFIDEHDSSKSISWLDYKPQLIQHVNQLLDNIKQHQFNATDHVVSKPKHQDECRRCDYYAICNSSERHQR